MEHIPAPPPFDPNAANRPAPAAASTASSASAGPGTAPTAPLAAARHVPPSGANSNRGRLLLGLAGLGLLAVLLIALLLGNRDGVSGARHDLKESAELVREKEREVAAAQQELEAKLADLQAARAQAQASAVKLNAEATKERRDARDTMVAGGEVTGPGDAERAAEEALQRSNAALGNGRRTP
jgi:hypothetical protein